MHITLEQIDKERKKGLRPEAVGCFIFNKKILFVYKKKHDLWQFPQGGINNMEEVEDAFWREMREELGRDFLRNYKKESLEILGEDEIHFFVPEHKERGLKSDDGKNIEMEGKKYYLVKAEVLSDKIDIEKTEFDRFQWANFNQAKTLAKKIYQKEKKRMVLDILDLLKEKKLL